MNAISWSALIVLLLILLSSGGVVGQSTGKWPRFVPITPMTQDVEVLYGDPDKAGEPFVIRIRELAGGLIPPHRHHVDEHITVVQGSIFFAVGEKFDRASLKELKAGSYAFIPKGSVMFGYTPDAAIVQVHGIGPFHIDWRSASGWHEGLKTLDSPNAGNIFKFKRGELVVTPRGTGRIRQGYDSGEVIGYEVESEKGELFMAEECEIEGYVSRSPRRKPGERACFVRGEPLVLDMGKPRQH
ncbi:MAG TPA: cupin domain-containing protein [Pyrinomonadaceae bacterium]